MGKTYAGNTSDESVIPKKIYAGDASNHSVPCKVAYCGDSNGKSVEVWRNTSLPSTYQKVEYIFNTGGTQYINTGVKVNSDTRIFIDLQVKEYSSYDVGAHYMAGCSQSNANNFLDLSISQGSIRLFYNWANSNGYISSGIQNRRSFNVNRDYDGKTYVNSTLLFSSTSTFSTVTNDYILFGYMSSGSVTICQKVYFNLYSFKVWQRGAMIRDMYPCYLKSDTQVVGMYDLIGNQFYGNSGTGIFYKGPDVN